MAKPKKVRNKKYTPSAKNHKQFQKTLRTNLNEMWFAGGHCLTEIECENAITAEQVDYVLSKKQQWSILLLCFCENDFEYYTKVKSLPPITTFIETKELEIYLETELDKFKQQQNQRQLISPGWFMVPSPSVDLFNQRTEIIDRFEHWGAFDPLICDIAYQCKMNNRKKDKAA